jgi:O-antigen/teichoic acid export membrane protein
MCSKSMSWTRYIDSATAAKGQITLAPKLSIALFFRAGSGAFFSQLVSLACLPILFRLYSPEAFGAWATTMAVVMGVGTFATLRYELAIVIEREHHSASTVFWLTIFLGVTLSLLSSAAIVFFASSLLSQVGQELKPSIPAVCAWAMLVALGQGLNGWILRDGGFETNSLIQVCNASVANAVHIAGGFLGAAPLWLTLGSVAGQAAALALAMTRVARSPPTLPSGGWSALWTAAARHRKFPLFSAPFTLLTIARERAPVLILATVVSPAQVGWYSQAWRLVNMPVGLTSGALRPVLFHAAAAQGVAAQESRVDRMLVALAVLGAPWLGVLAYDPQAAFSAILGSAWGGAGDLAAILAVPAFFFALSNWMDRFLDLQGRQDLNLWTELAITALSLGVLKLALDQGLTLNESVTAQAVVLALSYLGFIILTFRVVGFRPASLVRTVVLSVLLASSFFLFTLVVGTHSSSQLAFFLGAALAALLGLLMATRTLRGWG